MLSNGSTGYRPAATGTTPAEEGILSPPTRPIPELDGKGFLRVLPPETVLISDGGGVKQVAPRPINGADKRRSRSAVTTWWATEARRSGHEEVPDRPRRRPLPLRQAQGRLPALHPRHGGPAADPQPAALDDQRGRRGPRCGPPFHDRRRRWSFANCPAFLRRPRLLPSRTSVLVRRSSAEERRRALAELRAHLNRVLEACTSACRPSAARASPGWPGPLPARPMSWRAQELPV